MTENQGFLELQADLVQMGDSRLMTVNQVFKRYKLIRFSPLFSFVVLIELFG
jgi:hypothetical protein